MQISDFILQHMEPILVEWERFASTLQPAAAGMSGTALRDHAREILEAVARDLRTPQTAAEQMHKSLGHAPPLPGAPTTAAESHAVLRAQSGFDIIQLVAEYRALRASVLRLWAASDSSAAPEVQDLIRFNEAIDQAIVESVEQFHSQVERSRNLLLGVLGHDMRAPLNAIVMTASYLAALNLGGEVSKAAQRLLRGGASIQALLNDLVDFNRSKLGMGIKIVPTHIDLAAEVGFELEQLRMVHADCAIEFEASPGNHGYWDAGRIKQVARNLVSNAIRYGDPQSPVHVLAYGTLAEARLEVTNSGPEIPLAETSRIFDPLWRGTDDSGKGDGLGLGLFIVREIVDAHAGDIEVSSRAGRTTFTIRLPRRGAVESGLGGD